jgi:hypothetical protein
MLDSLSHLETGQVLVDGKLVGAAGGGAYVAREKSPLAKPSGKSAWE